MINIVLTSDVTCPFRKGDSSCGQGGPKYCFREDVGAIPIDCPLRKDNVLVCLPEDAS